MSEIQCNRCGKCCHSLITTETGYKIGKPCKYILKLPSGKTWCRIYNNRLGTKIDEKYKCGLIKTSVANYKDCPYNILKPGKPEAEEDKT